MRADREAELGAGLLVAAIVTASLMADAAPQAEKRGLKLVLKPHGGGSGASEEILRCIEKVSHPNFKVWYDFPTEAGATLRRRIPFRRREGNGALHGPKPSSAFRLGPAALHPGLNRALPGSIPVGHADPEMSFRAAGLRFFPRRSPGRRRRRRGGLQPQGRHGRFPRLLGFALAAPQRDCQVGESPGEMLGVVLLEPHRAAPNRPDDSARARVDRSYPAIQ